VNEENIKKQEEEEDDHDFVFDSQNMDIRVKKVKRHYNEN